MLTCCVVDWDKPAMCKALWTYKAQMPCDLSFAAGKNGQVFLVYYYVILALAKI